MHCEQCAATIRRYLREQSGVTHAEVDFETGRGRVVVESTADLDRLVADVETMGYDAALVDAH